MKRCSEKLHDIEAKSGKRLIQIRKRSLWVMSMLIEVCTKDFCYEMVESHILADLIERDAIIAFRRSDGWVMLGEDELRESYHKHFGLERRVEASW